MMDFSSCNNIEDVFDTSTDYIWKDFLDTVDIESLNGNLLNNFVLIEVEGFVYDEIGFSNSLLKIDNTFSPYKYIVRTGIVAKLPKELESWKENKFNGITWLTDMECDVGDRVWFYGSSMMSGEKLTFSGKKYVLINYADLYMAQRGEQVIPLNGNVILEPILKRVEALSYSKDTLGTDWAKIAYIGLNNREYQDENKVDDPSLEVGMKVCITGIPMRKLELEPYLKFSDKEYIVCQNCEIHGYLKD